MKTKKFLWAAAHTITEEQKKSLSIQGKWFFLKKENEELYNKITSLQRDSNKWLLAIELIEYCFDNNYVLVQPAGSPAFHYVLGGVNMRKVPTIAEQAWSNKKDKSIEIMFSFSKRVSKDIPQEDGSVLKTSIFKHEGWV